MMKQLIALSMVLMAGAVFAGDITLPSGRVLKNAQVSPIIYTTGIPSSYALKYETTADIDSKKEISAEISDIWETFRLEVEKGKYESAVIMVVGPSNSSVFPLPIAEQRNFVFEKLTGEWKMTLPSIWQEGRKP